MSDESNHNKNGLWDWVKAISTLVTVGIIAYKIYLTPIELTVDFPTLLSLLLALFSVGLAALFYFKATETSNTFYDNTYNFTKDIAQLLVKMESGFGERLRNLEYIIMLLILTLRLNWEMLRKKYSTAREIL